MVCVWYLRLNFFLVLCVLALIAEFYHFECTQFTGEVILPAQLDAPRPGVAQKNVLLIIVDDLKPALGIYGDPNAITPNIDRLGSQSHLFQHSYAQVAYCMPSRASFLTSRRPDTTQVLKEHYWRNRGGNFSTMPEYFKANGYYTMGLGKVFHYKYLEKGQRSNDEPYSWSGPFKDPNLQGTTSPCNFGKNRTVGTQLMCPVPLERTRSKKLSDMLVTEYAQTIIQASVKKREPFFLAVGYRRPHIPFEFPEEYLKLHPGDNIQIYKNRLPHKSIPSIALHNFGGNFEHYQDMRDLNITSGREFTFSPKVQVTFRRMYYSAVTYIDHQVGILLQTLADLGLANDTVVAFISDHGFALGENGQYSKSTNFEVATKVPWMIHDPASDGSLDNFKVTNPLLLDWKQSRRATQPLTRSVEPVELIDLFPTLLDLSGVPPVAKCPLDQPGQSKLCTQGKSRANLWKKSSSNDDPKPTESYALSQFARKRWDFVKKIPEVYMGYSIRSHKFRYTEWVPLVIDNLTCEWHKGIEPVELYQYNNESPILMEEENLAVNPNYEQEIAKLSQILRTYSQKHCFTNLIQFPQR